MNHVFLEDITSHSDIIHRLNFTTLSDAPVFPNFNGYIISRASITEIDKILPANELLENDDDLSDILTNGTTNLPNDVFKFREQLSHIRGIVGFYLCDDKLKIITTSVFDKQLMIDTIYRLINNPQRNSYDESHEYSKLIKMERVISDDDKTLVGYLSTKLFTTQFATFEFFEFYNNIRLRNINRPNKLKLLPCAIIRDNEQFGGRLTRRCIKLYNKIIFGIHHSLLSNMIDSISCNGYIMNVVFKSGYDGIDLDRDIAIIYDLIEMAYFDE